MNCYLQLRMSVVLVLMGCVYQPPIPQSQGHIGSEQKVQATATLPASDVHTPEDLRADVSPKPIISEETYSVVVHDVPVSEILYALVRESKINVDIHPGIVGSVTINAVDQTLPTILQRISKQVSLRYQFEDNILSITPDFPFLHTYKVNYVNMDRDASSSVGVAAEIASTGNADGSTSESGNKSTTTVASKSRNNFWELLTDTIRKILKASKTQAANGEDRAQQADTIRLAQEQKLKQVEAVSKAGVGADKLFQEAFKSSLLNISENKDDVIINPVAGTVTVMATEKQHKFIQQYIHIVMASVQRQVLIEATIVEVQLNHGYQQGIDWSRLGNDGGNNGFTFKQMLGGASTNRTSPLFNDVNQEFVVGFLNNSSVLGNLSASLRLLEKFGHTRVLSSPKLMAINNQTAILKVVNNLVYFTVKSDVVTNANTITETRTSTPHTVPVGVVMSVTPQVSDSGLVILNIRPTISSIVGKGVQDPVNTLSFIPEIQVREMESVLQVSSGQTIVLGGLMEDTNDSLNNTVPMLSKIPFFGRLFQGENNNSSKTELVIFLRSTVISNNTIDSKELQSFKQFLPNQSPAKTDKESFQ